MSHWAEIDADNKVIRVTVGDNNDPAGDEGYQWLIDNLGGTWIKTSYNGTIRYNYAGFGYTYDSIDDAFIAPAPCEHDSLSLNAKKQWECSECEALIEAITL
jgi:hypothetical protein